MNNSLSPPIEFPDARTYAPKILAAQLEILYRRIPTLVVIDGTFSAGAMLFSLWYKVPRKVVLIWLATLLATLILRAAAYAMYRRLDAEHHARRLAALIVVSLALSGALWAAFFGYIFHATPIFIEHFYIFFFLGGLGIAAMSSLSVYLPAFYVFFLPPMLLVSGLSIGVGNFAYILFGAVGVAYALSLGVFARSKNASLVESLSLRFQLFNMARQLGEQRDTAERANIAKSKFLAAASHDLRQPLHAIGLFTSALEEHAVSPETRDIVANIKAAAAAAESLFNSLLDISRLDAGVLRPEVSDFALNDLLARLVAEYEQSASEKRLSIDYIACDFVVRSDPVLLERILRNFLSNAVRYTHAGKVCVSCSLSGDKVRIAVTDTGIGIAVSKHAEIFDEFYQVDNPERDRAKGLGLGLAIVKRIAELLKHSVDMQSTPGVGSCFAVTAPLGVAANVIDAPVEADMLQAADVSGLRVMVIDDDRAARVGAHTLLELWGCEVLCANDEEEAVALLRKNDKTPDVIVADYRLREHCTGLQAIERVRLECAKSIPALIVSGDTSPDRLREITASGHTLAHKPVRPAVLRAFLRNAKLTA